MQSRVEKLKIKAAFLLTYICNRQSAVKGNISVETVGGRMGMLLCMECTFSIIAAQVLLCSCFHLNTLRLPAAS